MNTKLVCPVYKKCGGCQLHNMDYPRQLAFKQKKCDQLLRGFHKVSPIIGMEKPYYYRNKVQRAFQRDRNGRILAGIYQSSTRHVVQVKSCITENQKAGKILDSIKKLLISFKLSPFDEFTGRGFLRHVLVKCGFSTGEIMVVLVTGTPIFPSKKNFVNALLKLHPEITTIVHNIHKGNPPMVLGPQEQLLYGRGYIYDELCGCRFRISAKSFYQINPLQTQILYNKAMELAEIEPGHKILDAYCGIGTIGLVAAKSAGQVIGVELNKDAVKDAINNAKENGIKNARFYTGDAGDFLNELSAHGESFDTVFMDPPRTGSTPSFLNTLGELKPQKIVYISCNPETLARDLKTLCSKGYKAEAIQPVDMFPHTGHVECVVLMTRKDG